MAQDRPTAPEFLAAITDFLRRTYALVPAGMEGRHLQMDKWLSSVLSA